MYTGETRAVEIFEDGIGVKIQAGQMQNHTEILMNYVKNNEWANRNCETYSTFGI